MAYIDRNELQNFPFTGTFYTSEIDKSLPLTQQVEQEVEICTVNCDIMQDSHARYGTNVHAVFAIYVPFDSDHEEVPVRRGVMFKGYQYGLLVAGKVIGVFPSQVGPLENYTDYVGDLEEHHCRGYVAYVEATDV